MLGNGPRRSGIYFQRSPQEESSRRSYVGKPKEEEAFAEHQGAG